MPGRKRATVLLALGLLAGMGTLTAYSATLYRLFCEVTGYGGTTQVAKGPANRVGDRVITVRFNADTDPKLPWSFEPAQRSIQVRVGENALAFYKAKSLAAEPVTGQAVYNVTPNKAGLYFSKIECFCFQEQVLNPGQAVDMPVQFFIDPAIVKDHNLDDVTTITLSYTFFRTAGTTAAKPVRAAALDSAEPPGAVR